MHLLIDIDDTLAVSTPSWTELTEKWMKSHKVKRTRDKSLDTYRLEDSFGLTQMQLSKYLCYMYDESHFVSLPVVPGAKEFIAWAISKGHTISFVTARPPHLLDVTEKWLSKNFELFERPYVMIGPNAECAFPLFASRLLDVLVDNSEDRCKKVQSMGGRAILFTQEQLDLLDESDISMLQKAASFEEVIKLLEED